MIRRRSREDLDRDRVLELALTRLAEVGGEAARRVSPERRAQHPGIPWAQIIGLRNRLTRGYDTINLDILWHVLMYDLPDLIEQLEKIVPDDGTD
ncbi:MAG: DUF86 domain-containing protein [Phycisphaerae bacterium]